TGLGWYRSKRGLDLVSPTSAFAPDWSPLSSRSTAPTSPPPATTLTTAPPCSLRPILPPLPRRSGGTEPDLSFGAWILKQPLSNLPTRIRRPHLLRTRLLRGIGSDSCGLLPHDKPAETPISSSYGDLACKHLNNMSENYGTSNFADGTLVLPNARRSKAWKHFEPNLVFVDGIRKAVCLYCGMKLTNTQKSGISSLINHVSKSCPKITAEDRNFFIASLKKKQAVVGYSRTSDIDMVQIFVCNIYLCASENLQKLGQTGAGDYSLCYLRFQFLELKHLVIQVNMLQPHKFKGVKRL
ncbi:hypothetical protein BRADI_2g25117v3, partial [Brachypodium distachyon]